MECLGGASGVRPRLCCCPPCKLLGAEDSSTTTGHGTISRPYLLLVAAGHQDVWRSELVNARLEQQRSVNHLEAGRVPRLIFRTGNNGAAFVWTGQHARQGAKRVTLTERMTGHDKDLHTWLDCLPPTAVVARQGDLPVTNNMAPYTYASWLWDRHSLKTVSCMCLS